jgi:hypothetical protein
MKIIETSTTSPSKKNVSRIPVLNNKIPRMKFKEDVIVMCKLFNREKIASNIRNVEVFLRCSVCDCVGIME